MNSPHTRRQVKIFLSADKKSAGVRRPLGGNHGSNFIIVSITNFSLVIGSLLPIYNGNRTEWSTIQGVIITITISSNVIGA